MISLLCNWLFSFLFVLVNRLFWSSVLIFYYRSIVRLLYFYLNLSLWLLLGSSPRGRIVFILYLLDSFWLLLLSLSIWGWVIIVCYLLYLLLHFFLLFLRLYMIDLTWYITGWILLSINLIVALFMLFNMLIWFLVLDFSFLVILVVLILLLNYIFLLIVIYFNFNVGFLMVIWWLLDNFFIFNFDLLMLNMSSNWLALWFIIGLLDVLGRLNILLLCFLRLNFIVDYLFFQILLICDLRFNLDGLKDLSFWDLWFSLYCLNYLSLLRLFLCLIFMILLWLMNFRNLDCIHDILVLVLVLYFRLFLNNIFNIFLWLRFHLTDIGNIRCHISLFRWLLRSRHSIINILKLTSILVLLSSHFPFFFFRISISLIFQWFFLLLSFLLIFLFQLKTKGMWFMYITLLNVTFVIFVLILLVIGR